MCVCEDRRVDGKKRGGDSNWITVGNLIGRDGIKKILTLGQERNTSQVFPFFVVSPNFSEFEKKTKRKKKKNSSKRVTPKNS